MDLHVKEFIVVVNDKERTGIKTLEKAIDAWNDGVYGLVGATGGIKVVTGGLFDGSWVMQVTEGSTYIYPRLASIEVDG